MLLKARVCEGGHQLLACPNNRKIDVEYAMYGRLKGGHVCGAFVLHVNCQAANSLDVVKNDCQGKQSCILYANNEKYGDPCFLTQKYVEVSEFGLINATKHTQYLYIIHLASIWLTA